jgi:Tfp pilus assembly protein PilO
MSMTDRDRKILMALIPLVVIGAYWFLLLAPKREEAATVQDQLAQAETVRDTAQQKASSLAGAKASYSADYATIIRLGKSIPTSVDMPSLLVQLDRAARGTGIKFSDIKAGERTAAAVPTGGTPVGGAGSPAAAGAPPASSGAGQAAQNAGNAVAGANAASGAAGADGTAAATGAPGLESVPLDFEFRGSFFDLADFFHRMKRFVRVANDKIVIRGRLMTINAFTFDTTSGFPLIKATVNATVYLAPKAQGVDAGGTPQGPASSSGTTPQPAATPAPATPTPTAAVTR